MTTEVLLRLHRIPQFAVSGVGLALLGWILRSPVSIPGADGIRLAQQVLMAFAPSLLGVCVIPPLPGLAGTTVRDSSVAAILHGIFAAGALSLGLWLWWLSGESRSALEFDQTVIGLLVVITVLAVRWWERSGLIVSAMAGVVLLLVWDGLAGALGVGGFADSYGHVHTDTLWPAHLAAVVAGALVAFVVLVVPHRPPSC